jgi:hypothetical protein
VGLLDPENDELSLVRQTLHFEVDPPWVPDRDPDPVQLQVEGVAGALVAAELASIFLSPALAIQLTG